MDVPAPGHGYEEDAQRTGLHSGEEEEHHEKKSVLKKVTDKAKKIKDNIIKKKHGHGEKHLHGAEEEEEEEEEGGYDEDDEREQEPEVHGVPMYESEAARDFVSSHEGGPAQGKPTGGRWEEDPRAPKTGTGEAVPGSYETKVADTSSQGRLEPGVIRSFEALSVSDQPDEKKEEQEKEEAEPERRETEEEQPHDEKSYIEKMSSAASVIVDKAAHAKEAAVSAAVGSAEYGKKIAETVYEKVADAGSAVGSTVSPQQQQQRQQGEGKEREGAAGAEIADAGKAKRVSMRDYLAEKLSPGEEDRVLCEVILEAIQKRREEKRDVREEVEEKTAAGSGEKKTGKGVVGKIKGAVTSLFGGSYAHPAQARGESREAVDSSRVKQEGGEGGPRLQESGN